MLELIDKIPKEIKFFFVNVFFYFSYLLLKLVKFRKNDFYMPGICRDQTLIVSLTTSPTRIKKSVPLILDNISKCVKEIHLNIPKLYRNKDPYNKNDIDFLIKKYDNLKVFYFEIDDGPILKILPTLRRFLGQKYTIISIDDDSWYANKSFLNIPEYAISSGQVTIEKQFNCLLPFGVETISYPMQLITLEFIKCLEKFASEQNCRLHDDFCVAAAIKLNRIPLIQRRICKFLCEESFNDSNALIYEDRTKITQLCSNYVKTFDTALK